MDINIYTIYDQAAKAYMKPIFLNTDGMAIRAFQDAVNSDTPSDISQHPEQFTMFKIGEYDDQKGLINSYDSPEYLAAGHELLEGNGIVEDIQVTADVEQLKVGGTK